MKYQISVFNNDNEAEGENRFKEILAMKWLNEQAADGWRLVSISTTPTMVKFPTDALGVVDSSLTVVMEKGE